MPLTTFAQNNGVIALTNVASRQAGFGAAGWLLLWGLLGKFGGVVLTIPDCVLGGATSFLFTSVLASGGQLVVLLLLSAVPDHTFAACSRSAC